MGNKVYTFRLNEDEQYQWEDLHSRGISLKEIVRAGLASYLNRPVLQPKQPKPKPDVIHLTKDVIQKPDVIQKKAWDDVDPEFYV